jgi:hypothetical protein
MLLHRRRTLADAGLSVPAKVGKQEAVAACQRIRHREPELMMCRERMKQNDRRAVAGDPVNSLRVTALDTVG